PARRLAGDVVEVRCGAADHRAERDHRIDAAALDDAPRDLRELPRPGAADDRDVIGRSTQAHDRIARAGQGRFRDQAVEPARDDREPKPGSGQRAFDRGGHSRRVYNTNSYFGGGGFGLSLSWPPVTCASWSAGTTRIGSCVGRTRFFIPEV